MQPADQKPVPPADSSMKRIIELESQIAHLQHDLNQLNQVVIEQQSTIEQLSRSSANTERRIQELNEQFEE